MKHIIPANCRGRKITRTAYSDLRAWIVRCIIAEQKNVRGVELTGDDILKNILIMAPMLDEAGQNRFFD